MQLPTANNNNENAVSTTNHKRPMHDITPTSYSMPEHGGGEK